MPAFAPELCYFPLIQQAPRSLAFDTSRDYDTWRRDVRIKLRELLGATPERAPLDLRIQFTQEHEHYTETRFLFCTERNADVPCHLLVPKHGARPLPIVICIQGHTSGMHNSLGRTKDASDAENMAADRDFAIQAIGQGYAALVLEQRCFGERIENRPPEVAPFGPGCQHATMTALLLGRTMIGDRVWDLSRAIDLLAEFPEIDSSRIVCLGESGGGTVTYYASCLDERISLAVAACCVCTFEESIGAIDHCVDNYIPGILRYFDMGDIACLMAPRPLVVVAGRDDSIFPFSGVQGAFATIESIYAAAGAPDRCRLVVGEGGHRFYASQTWPVVRDLAGW